MVHQTFHGMMRLVIVLETRFTILNLEKVLCFDLLTRKVFLIPHSMFTEGKIERPPRTQITRDVVLYPHL